MSNLEGVTILPNPIVDDRMGPKGADIAASFGNFLALTYWDLWCLLTAQQKYQGDINLLRQALVDKRLENKFHSSYKQDQIEDLITLTEDLLERLKPYGPVQNILQKLTERIIKKESQKAIRNILDQAGSHQPSEPMMRSPRKLLEHEAFRGLWNRLPIDPTPIAERLKDLFVPPKKHGHFPKGLTFALSRKVEKRIQKELAVSDSTINQTAHQYAVCRAALTLYHEHCAWDDSYCTMGDLGQDWVKAILNVVPTSIGLEPHIFLKDLLMFICWENYGLSDSDQVAKYFRSQLSKNEFSIGVQILNDIKHRAHLGFQKFNAENAERILSKLNILGVIGQVTKPSHLRLVAP